jgi:hypothetical protein
MTTQHSNIGLSVPELVVSAQEGSGAPTWPRIRNLPPEEQEPFGIWLRGCTQPIIEGDPMDEQDGYYTGDYQEWKLEQLAA